MMRFSLSPILLAALMLGALLLPAQWANQIQLAQLLHPPAAGAWLGYDDLGRNLAWRLLAGLRLSLWIVLWVVPLSAAIGVVLGIASAWSKGFIRQAINFVVDMFLAFPTLLLVIALAGVLGQSVSSLVMALTAVGWVGYAKLTRAQVLVLQQADHIQAAQALGTTTPRIWQWHILPLLTAPIIVEMTFHAAAVILSEAGLSFLGLGLAPPTATLGGIIRDGAHALLVAPHIVIFAGGALFLVVKAINTLGEQLRQQLSLNSRHTPAV